MKVVAVVGCGRIADSAHFPALSQMDEVRIKYACDLIKEKAEKIKEKYPKVENVITDYKEALNDPEVDVVYVLTPNFAHYTITMDALGSGKHVFCEKPITVSYALSKEMQALANEKGLMLNIGVCNRFHKSVELLQEMNEKGEFGKIYHVYCSFRGCRSIPGLGGAFTTKSMSGGGALIDWGVHFVDLILYILGDAKVKNVTADAYCEMAKDMKEYKYRSMWAEDTKDIENGTNDVDDFVSGYVRTDKANISINGCWAQNLDIGEMYIDFLGDKKGVRLNYGGQFQVFDGQTLETVKTEHDIPNMYLCEDKAFIESIETGVKNRSHIDRIMESMLVLDKMYESASVEHELTITER